MAPDHRFWKHTSEEMAELSDGEVALTVTSPPYWNAIDYDIHSASEGIGWYRTRKDDFGGYETYLGLLGRVFTETLRATKPGGFCAVVIGTVLHNRKHIQVPFHLVSIMEDIGWEFHQDIIWNKVTAGVKRAGVTIQHPYPGYYYPNIMTEYILVFRKFGEPIYRSANGKAEASEIPIQSLFKRDIANNVWHIAPVPPKTVEHPCPFPEEIPDRLIRLYSHKDDLVLDPFLGSGQTAKVALALDRNAVGYDIVDRYVDLAEIRIREPLKIRQQQLIARFEKIGYSQETMFDAVHA